MPLYLVSAEVEMMVRADSWEDAWEVARKSVQDSVRDDGFTIEGVNEVERIEDVPEEWRDSLPWGTESDDEATCAELMARDGK